jgi:hypothetical protein
MTVGPNDTGTAATLASRTPLATTEATDPANRPVRDAPVAPYGRTRNHTACRARRNRLARTAIPSAARKVLKP